MLLENVPRFWANVWLNIRSTRQGEAEINTRVPVNVNARPDTIIHTFAARALLGDLETGQSRIHQGPQAAQRGFGEEQRLARQEGERLGCRWSLASKWTSFVAVEMTEEQMPQGFRDRGVPEAQETEGSGLNLLRRRAVGIQAGRFPILPAEVEGDNEASEGSDESSDSEFSIISRGHLSDSDSDSDSDDNPGMDNTGAGAAGHQGLGGGGHGGHRGHQEGRGRPSGGQRQEQPRPPSSSRGGQSQHARRPAGAANVTNSSQGNDYSGQKQINITRSSDPHRKSDQKDSDKSSGRPPSTQTFPTFDRKAFYYSYGMFGKSSGFGSNPKSTG
jgi:hypothetical protein